MTILIGNIPLSGVTKDDLTARDDINHNSDAQIAQHVTVGVTDLWVEFPSDVIGNRPLAGIATEGVITGIGVVMMVSGYLWASGDPTNTTGLPVMSFASGVAGSLIRIGGYDALGNSKIRVTDGLGNLVASSLSEVSHTSKTGFAVCFDYGNYTTVHVRIYMNTGSAWVQEAHVDSGKTIHNFFNDNSGARILTWGESTGVGRGAKWRGLDLTVSYSASAADAPHLTQWPIYMSGGCVTAKGQGFYDQWSGASSTHAIGSGLRWQDVGDTHDRQSPTSHVTGGNDADSTFVSSGVADEKQTFVNATDAHPLASITSPVIDNLRPTVTLRNLAGGKVAANPIIRLGGTDVTANVWTSGPSYQGQESASDLSRPGGGSWAVADLAPGAGLEWGMRSFSVAESGGATISGRVTAISSPIPTYHTEYLPTGEPFGAALDVPRQVQGAKGRILRPDYDTLAELRPGATGSTLRRIRETDEILRQVTRAHGRSGSVLVRR